MEFVEVENMAQKIKINELNIIEYAEFYGDRAIPITFSDTDIQNALDTHNSERRSFQGNLEELLNEWNMNSDINAYCEKQKNYHCLRIATLIKSGTWKEPILVYKDRKTILDGQHRVRAASFLNETEINAIIVECVLSDNEKEKLWNSISENGNVVKALQLLNIPYST